MPVWLLVCFFLFTMTAVAAACSVFLSRAKSQASAQPDSTVMSLAQPMLRPVQAAIYDLFRDLGRRLPAAHLDENPWRKRLAAAGYRWESALPVFYGLRMGLAAFLGVAMTILGETFGRGGYSSIIACGSGIALGWLMPDRLVVIKARARARRLRLAIPAALDMLSMSLEGGQTLDAALLDTARALQATYVDLSDELYQVHLEMRASNSRGDALRRLAARTGEVEIRKFTNLMIDADRFGTSLVPALRSHARTLRTRFRQQAQEMARKVAVKLIFPVFFLIFPCVLLVTLGPACILMVQQLHAMSGQ
jgi:tight adherence protein C